MSGANPEQSRRNKRLVTKLLLATVGMFAFGFALVPLYRVLCEITGQGVWIASEPVEAREFTVDRERWVTVEFAGTVNGSGPWAFTPETTKMRINPGELYTTSYRARNLTEDAKMAQVVYSVAPVTATRHLVKPECFCFRQQQFQAGEERELKMAFYIDPGLPANVTTVTLSYTLFDITGQQAN